MAHKSQFGESLPNKKLSGGLVKNILVHLFAHGRFYQKIALEIIGFELDKRACANKWTSIRLTKKDDASHIYIMKSLG